MIKVSIGGPSLSPCFLFATQFFYLFVLFLKKKVPKGVVLCQMNDLPIVKIQESTGKNSQLLGNITLYNLKFDLLS